MNKAEKEMQQLRKEEELNVYRKILTWIVVAVFLEIFVLLANRYYVHLLTSEIERFQLAVGNVLSVLQYGGLVLGVIFIVLTFIAQKNGKNILYLSASAGFFLAISLISYLFLFSGDGAVTLMLTAIPTCAALIIVYYIYQKEFFMLSALSCLGIFGFWILRSIGMQRIEYFYAYVIFMLVVIIAMVYATLQLKRNGGNFVWKDQTIPMLKKDAKYTAVWATCAFVAVLLLMTAVFGVTFAYYSILITMAWLFIMAVYFTSRLM